MAVRSVPRWLIIGLIVSAAGVCCLGVERIRSRRGAEPNPLPRSVGEAQPLVSAEMRRLPPLDEASSLIPIPLEFSGASGSNVRTTSHLTTWSSLMPSAVLGQAPACNFTPGSVGSAPATAVLPW